MGCFSEYPIDETTSKSKTTISEVASDSETTSTNAEPDETSAEIDAKLMHGVV